MHTHAFVVIGIAAFTAGGLAAAPATAASPGAQALAKSGKQYVTVSSAAVAKNHRSVSGEVRWHTGTLPKGTNRFTIWAGVESGRTAVTALGTIRLSKARLDKKGVAPFTITWGKDKARRVGKADAIRLSATQRFDRTGTGGRHERAMFQTVEVPTSDTGERPPPVQSRNCAASDLHKGADLSGCLFQGLDLQRVNIASANIADARFIGCNLRMTTIANSLGHNPSFFYNDMWGADLIGSSLDRSSFGGNLYKNVFMLSADLSNATFAPLAKGADVPFTDTNTKCWPNGQPGPCQFSFM